MDYIKEDVSYPSKKNWEQLTLDEKIERMREVIKTLQSSLDKTQPLLGQMRDLPKKDNSKSHPVNYVPVNYVPVNYVPVNYVLTQSCCVCSGWCNHTGPHTYCKKHSI